MSWKKLSLKMDVLSKVDKDTLYFDGLHKIQFSNAL